MSSPALNNTENSRASRAPFAAAVSFLVMIAGGAFIFLSAQQTAEPVPPKFETPAQTAQSAENDAKTAPIAQVNVKPNEIESTPSANEASAKDQKVTALDDTILGVSKREVLPLSPTASVGTERSGTTLEDAPAPTLIQTAGVAPTLAPEKKWTFSEAASRSDGFAPSLSPAKVEAFEAAARIASLTPSVSPRTETRQSPATAHNAIIDTAASTQSNQGVVAAAPPAEPTQTAALPLEDKIRTTIDVAHTAPQDLTVEEALIAPPLPFFLSLERDVTKAPTTVSVSLKKGENFVDALKRAGVRANDRNEAASAFGKLQNLRRLRPGQTFTLTVAQPNQTLFQIVSDDAGDQHLVDLNFRADAETRIILTKKIEGGFDAEKADVPLTTKLMNIEGDIKGSLYLSAKEQGAPDRAIANLANAFAYDVDFQREIFGGDEFEAIFEVKYDDEGKLVSSGDILYARLKWRGKTKEKGYYRFASANGGSKADFFDANGQSAKRLLMKTPIDGARLSSGFGTRKHPILGYRKAHKGVDFAARRGTPIYAAGDGVVERANRFGSFGNYIKIRHSNGYKTAYAHLKGFKKGIRAGKRVEQGDVIGYVGTTGRSTGPHLHYEVHYKGKQVNPQRLKIATGVTLKGADLKKFETVRNKIDALRAAPQPDIELVAKEDNNESDAL